MQMTSIKRTNITNLTRQLLLFVMLIGFSFSTLEKISVNSDETINFNKILFDDLSVLKHKKTFEFFSSLVEYEKHLIIKNESLENFDKSLTYKYLIKIYKKVIDSNYENIPVKETNEILDIFIENISEISKISINNNYFFNEAIFNLLGIFSNYENDYFNFENFNIKIIPMIKKIICKENYEYNNHINKSTKYFLTESIILFTDFMKNINFFLNLDKNIKLKKLFINMIDEYINFVIIDKNCINHYIIVINTFFYDNVLENIKNNYFSKKVYFEILDCFLNLFKHILDTKTLTFKSFNVTKCFIDNLFKSPFFLENRTDLDTLTYILKKIINIKLEFNKKEEYDLSIDKIKFYIKYIATIPIEKNHKNHEIYKLYEGNVEKVIIFIKSINISKKNSMYNYNSYYEINEYLYNSNITFENEKFNNPHLINSIKDTFYEYILKIVMFELDNIDFKITEIRKNYIIRKFLSKTPKELEKYNFKKIISNKVIKLIEQFQKTFGNQELLENNYFTAKDKNLLEFAFLYGFIDIN